MFRAESTSLRLAGDPACAIVMRWLRDHVIQPIFIARDFHRTI